MDTTVERLLRESGIPVECCPVCEMTNWEFTGSVDTGLQTTTCRTCGQRYQFLDGFQRIMWHAGTLKSAANVRDASALAASYSALMRTWAECRMGRWECVEPMVVQKGHFDPDDDNDAPF